MFRVDDGFLDDVGLSRLPRELRAGYRSAIRDRILGAAITRTVAHLPGELIENLEAWVEDTERTAIDGAVVAAWLQIRCPQFRVVLDDERRLTKIELATAAPELVALEQAVAGGFEMERASEPRTHN